MQKQKQIKNRFFFILAFTAILFCLPQIVSAATIYFSPASGSFKTGDLINASIYVNTQSQAINNTEGSVYFQQIL
jgi:hypothetical protein